MKVTKKLENLAVKSLKNYLIKTEEDVKNGKNKSKIG